jgi:hypothetical protein
MSDSSSASVVGGLSLFISIAGMIYTAINHKKIRGKCCGHELSASIDIEPTTPVAAPAPAPAPAEKPTKERRCSVSSVKSDDSIVTIARHNKKYPSDF